MSRRGFHKSDNVFREIVRHEDRTLDPLTVANIYFLHAPGHGIKIGITKDVQKRIKALQPGCPAPLEVLGMIPGDRLTERVLHKRLANYRLHGEWFSEEILPLCRRIMDKPAILQTGASAAA